MSQTVSDTTAAHQCPAQDDRKIHHDPRPAERHRYDEQSKTWHFFAYDEIRQILRSDFVKQAGFRAEQALESGNGLLKNPPVLFLEGELHHRMRRETNRFFTPTVIDAKYRNFMNRFADELIAELKRKKRVHLNELSMQMAMRVAARVVGLSNSVFPGMGWRLTGMLGGGHPIFKKLPPVFNRLRAQSFYLMFLVIDVIPAVRARRKNPLEDVFSYLITRDYSNLEMLTEGVVYGVAGMATTREFMSVALWHLLERPHLRQRMLAGEQEERYAILHEILRLEPIVGHIMRRAIQDITIESEGKPLTIPAGTLLDLNVFAANQDTTIAGENGASLCPMRPLESPQGKVPEYALSFGDGYHRCPGSFIAIQESDIFLRKLLAIDSLRIEREPEVHYNEVVTGYEVRKLVIVVD